MLDLSFVPEIWKYLVRPFQWWFRADRKSDHLSYAMSIEAIPNPQGWITAAVASFYVECDLTRNNTSFERIINLKEADVLYTKSGVEQEELQAELAERIQKYINIPIESDYARRTINMQIMIEGAVVWTIALIMLAFGFISIWAMLG